MQIFTSILDPQLAPLIRSGAVGVMPTDTVYGLVCSVADTAAVERLYRLKNRKGEPGTVIAGTLQQLIDIGLRARYLKAVEQYWPNPLSVIIPCGDELAYIHLGKDSLAVRIPAHDHINRLLQETGALLTAMAARPDGPVATNLQEAQQYFGDSVDFYVDGGTITDPVPSTLIRVLDDAIDILRPGAVHIDENGRITT